MFECGIGQGRTGHERAHVILVARPPHEPQSKRIVGVYAGAILELDKTWTRARTRYAALFPADRRPIVREWSGRQGMRRWAKRDWGKTYPALLKQFASLRRLISKLTQPSNTDILSLDQTYADLEGTEGRLRKYFVQSRKREAKLRRAKIREVLRLNDGRLICEVPGCGFDFQQTYGEVGVGYGHVHHLMPLGRSDKNGQRTNLQDLRIVCANCHAMIHRFGQCRSLDDLISARKPGARKSKS